METQKANLEHDLIQKQAELENNQKLSAQEKETLRQEINHQTNQIRAKENEIALENASGK
ncbi:hypothetical protein OC707_01500 ['Opuntia sp.' phytoplasma]|uniref:hypothetical protein n=1 Tax=Candidatus Phytoplasma asiaticum TaxID=2763338 RepID=UPI00271261B5|nr:hypothetical protein ['Opuntia sp.' phytoplasma]MDO8054124.1 hypothetical protein ['Opuntia sp.' phytoplasma]MDO8057968.1 hypothetical protein ['Opuntia sp.' phytoplasma]